MSAPGGKHGNPTYEQLMETMEARDEDLTVRGNTAIIYG